MKKLIIRSVMMTALIMMTFGCVSNQNNFRLTYKSVPSGATIVEEGSGKNYGTTPLTMNYNLSPDSLQSGYIKTRGFTAHWPDGRKKQISYLYSNFASLGKNLEYTVIAPSYGGGYQQQQNNNYAAQQEYNNALVNYNQALKQYDDAKLLRGMHNFGAPKSQGTIFGLINNFTSSEELKIAGRNLEIARERLARAKANL